MCIRDSYISTSKGNENSMTYSDAQLASQLTKDYEELILGRTVLEKVIAQYQLCLLYTSRLQGFLRCRIHQLLLPV